LSFSWALFTAVFILPNGMELECWLEFKSHFESSNKTFSN
jgi:hypothetical protein